MCRRNIAGVWHLLCLIQPSVDTGISHNRRAKLTQNYSSKTHMHHCILRHKNLNGYGEK